MKFYHISPQSMPRTQREKIKGVKMKDKKGEGPPRKRRKLLINNLSLLIQKMVAATFRLRKKRLLRKKAGSEPCGYQWQKGTKYFDIPQLRFYGEDL